MFFPVQIYPKSISFGHISDLEGLPHNFITAVVQDNYGFIWFGTINGLCRYDGYRITVFQHDENDSTSLINYLIRSLIRDSEGKLWISTGENGVLEEFDDINKQLLHHNLRFDNVIESLTNKSKYLIDKTGCQYNKPIHPYNIYKT